MPGAARPVGRLINFLGTICRNSQHPGQDAAVARTI